MPVLTSQALLRAGSIYGVLDLLGKHKRGVDFFSRAELNTLHMLKRELLFWEDVYATGWKNMIARRNLCRLCFPFVVHMSYVWMSCIIRTQDRCCLHQ